jgi:hypothetical protein
VPLPGREQAQPRVLRRLLVQALALMLPLVQAQPREQGLRRWQRPRLVRELQVPQLWGLAQARVLAQAPVLALAPVPALELELALA